MKILRDTFIFIGLLYFSTLAIIMYAFGSNIRTFAIFLANVNFCLILPTIFIIYVIFLTLSILFKKKKIIIENKNKFNFIIEMLFLVCFTSIFVIFFEFNINLIVNYIRSYSLDYPYYINFMTLIVIGISIALIVISFLPVLYFSKSAKRIMKNDEEKNEN